jgi:8-oxo-dGTP pyrophosphatase MutT (NUDIX family)
MTVIPALAPAPDVREVQVRRKVVVVPFWVNYKIKKNNRSAPSFLVLLVRHASSGDFGFVSGGVKTSEDFQGAASRELFEETGIRHQRTGPMAYLFEYSNTFRPQHACEAQETQNRIVERIQVFTCRLFGNPSETAMDIARGLRQRFNRSPCSETNDVAVECLENVVRLELEQDRARVADLDRLCDDPKGQGPMRLWDVQVRNQVAQRISVALSRRGLQR